MRALKFITGHVTYNPAYTYKLQLKTTFGAANSGLAAFIMTLAQAGAKIW